MSEILFYICIFPLQQVIDFILNVLFNITKNYGISIILLSLLVNIFLLKIFIYTDKKAKEESGLKAKLDARIKAWKGVYKKAKLYAFTQTLYRQNHYHPIYALRALGGLALQIPFFWAVYEVIKNLEAINNTSFLWIKDLSLPDSVLGLHLLPIIMTILTLINVFISSKERGARIQGSIIAAIFLVLLYDMPSALVLYWTCNMSFSLLKTIWQNYQKNKNVNNAQNKNMQKTCQAIKIADSEQPKFTRIINKIFTPYSTLSQEEYKIYRDISIFAILNTTFMICIFTPYAVYSSDVSQFDPSQTAIVLSGLFGIFLFITFLFIYLASFFYRTRLLKFMTVGILSILLIGLIYSFILDFNIITGESYSQMDNLQFKNPHAIPGSANKFVDLFIGIVSLTIATSLIIIEKLSLLISKILKIILTSTIIVSFFYLFNIYKNWVSLIEMTQASNQNITQNDDAQSLLPSFQKDLGSFSKIEKNVLVLLFDGFTGSHLEIIFDQFPDMQKSFSGFTYYPNTISLDGHTGTTAHTILTGHGFGPYAMRQSSMEKYYQHINSGLKEIYISLAKKGFEVRSYGMPHIKENDIKDQNISIYESKGDYLPYYVSLLGFDSQIEELRRQNRPIGEMFSIGLFYFAPYTLRTRIYKDFIFGDYSWLFGSKTQIASYINGISVASQLIGFARNVNVMSKNKTFKYIHTHHTHFPFSLDADSCLPAFKYETKLPVLYKPYFKNPRHYDNEICAIKETISLIQYLKKESAYDNTMIILISDHSYNDLFSNKIKNDTSLGNNPNPLLLIKNFSDNRDLRVDNRFMSNADIYGIICDELELDNCREPNILKTKSAHREIIHTLNIGWTPEARRANKLLFEKIWLVKDNLLDPANWTEITEQISREQK